MGDPDVEWLELDGWLVDVDMEMDMWSEMIEAVQRLEESDFEIRHLIHLWCICR